MLFDLLSITIMSYISIQSTFVPLICQKPWQNESLWSIPEALKLMERNIPINLLVLIERWFAVGATCFKWGCLLSRCFGWISGVRQAGVLSPYLFAIYTDSMVRTVSDSKFGCYVNGALVSILLYAHDILLLSPSVSCLQELLLLREQELK